MIKETIQSSFRMRRTGESEWLPAAVPGSVYGDLLANGKMEDPFYRANEEDALKLMEYDYEYETVFDAQKAFLDCEQTMLSFEGLDTLADVFLNGQLLGQADNMHRIWEYPVKGILTETDNHLHIVFHSPVKFFREAYAQNPLSGSSDCMDGFSMLRKAHSMSGWDWGPRLPDAGIWRNINLIGIDDARFENVYIMQEHEKNPSDGLTEVKLSFRIDFKRLNTRHALRFFDDPEAADYTFHIDVFDPNGQKIASEDNAQEILISDPQLWWPNGYGAHPLYQVCITLLHGDTELDRIEKNVGLRTMTMTIQKDEHGESFAPTVNGIQFFAMGADYIPEDNLLGRVNPQRTHKLLEDCIAANFNFIRVWGGGYYPDDWFYDSCDKLGLFVWQDFMFACAVYDLSPAFEKNIRAEFVDNIRRLRHHASLALWCGNNEIESSITWWDFPQKYRADYIKLFEYIIPSILQNEDPQRFYWPSSPSSVGNFDNPCDEKRGDSHYWDVWHGNKPFTEYRKFNFRFLSEFGFQSFPCLASVKQFTLPEDRNIFSYVMEKHQRNGSANGKIMTYLEQTYLYPTDFDTLLYASQLLQADAIRYGVEHFRRIRGICMGTIYWQLNDCWPVASWASIDYYGRWKALHYMAKRFFAPVMLSCAEEGTLTQNTNVNAQPFDLKKSIHLCLSNETLQQRTVSVRWALRDTWGNILRGGEKEIAVKPLTSVWLEQEELADADIYENYVSYEALENGIIVSSGSVLLCAPKFFHFRHPALTCQVKGDKIIVSASAYARSVEITNEDGTILLSDNYFDMNAGTKEITVLEGTAKNLSVRSVYDIR